MVKDKSNVVRVERPIVTTSKRYSTRERFKQPVDITEKSKPVPELPKDTNEPGTSSNKTKQLKILAYQPVVKMRKLSDIVVKQYYKKNGDSEESAVPKENDAEFQPGTPVWAKLTGHRWWPALIVNSTTCGMSTTEEGKVWVYWFGDNMVSEINKKYCVPFVEHFQEKWNISKNRPIKFIKAVAAACKEHCRKTCGIMEKWLDDNYISWGMNNFPWQPTANKETSYLQYASFISDKLVEIAARNSLLKKKSERKEKNKTEMGRRMNKQLRKEGIQSSKGKQLLKEAEQSTKGKVRNTSEKRSDKDCLRCNIPATYDHPLFEGRLCEICLERWKLTFFSCERDYMYVHCCVCGHIARGSVMCVNAKCGRMYCNYCALTFKIERSLQWVCFLCTPAKNGLLMKREFWKMNVFKSFVATQESKMELPSDMFPKERLTVLSLYDNSGTGLRVLQDVGITVNTYFMSSLDCDKFDIITDEKVENLGNVDRLRSDHLEQMQDIELVFAYVTTMPLYITTSPKKEFEAPEKRVILEELIFKFYWTYRDILHCRKNQHVFWLYGVKEGLLSPDHKRVIERYLQAEEMTEEENNVKFWTNIPCCERVFNLKSIFKSLSLFFK